MYDKAFLTHVFISEINSAFQIKIVELGWEY